MKIEKCGIEDLSRIIELDSYIECSWTKENILAAFNNGISTFIKAVEDEKTIGYLGFDVILDEICINNIAVDAAYRRRGVASKLLMYLNEYASETKKKKIWLEVNEHNFSAIALYEKAGFEFVSLRRNYYGKNLNAAVYVKVINGIEY